MFSAGIHHLVLDQNLLILEKELVIGKRIRNMWEKKMGPLVSYLLSTAKREEIFHQFTEWLKWQPLEDYKHFVGLLHKTGQDSLVEQLTASCRSLLCHVYCCTSLTIMGTNIAKMIIRNKCHH